MKKISVSLLLALLFANAHSQNCPAISVIAPYSPVPTGTVFSFTASVGNVATPTYNWVISSGTIVSGQGTATISVDPGKEPGSCTASLEVGGVPANCPSMSSATADIVKGPEKVVSAKGVAASQINDAVKTFISKTDFKNVNNFLMVTIHVYSTSLQPFSKTKALLEKAFTADKILPYRYEIVDKGIAKVAVVDFFMP